MILSRLSKTWRDAGYTRMIPRFIDGLLRTAIAILIVLVSHECGAEEVTRAKPNILVLMADDLGWGDISLHGGSVPTPNIDRLAREGVELQKYYGYPLCSPARAALLTGQMPRRFGITQALGPREPGLPAGLATLPRTLQAAGYQTSLVGKWHLGTASPPLQSGFDHFYGFQGPEIDYFRHTNRNGQVDWQRNGATLHEEGYSTFLLAEEAIRRIEEHDRQQPFFLQVAFNAPHFPFAAPAEYLAKYRDLNQTVATRAAMVDALDNVIGRILEALDDEGLRQQTLVVFLSDNGADQSGRNVPWRSGKGSVYEGGIRLSCLMRWPGVITADSQSRQPITTQDLFPTLISAANVRMPDSTKVDGQDLWPAIQTGRLTDRGPFLIAAGQAAVFDGDWKLIEFSDGTTSLFDLSQDPGESRDLNRERMDIATRLQAMLAEWKQQFPMVQPRRRPGGRPIPQ